MSSRCVNRLIPAQAPNEPNGDSCGHQCHAVPYYQHQNVVTVGAEGNSDSDLPRALADAMRNDSVNANCGQQQREHAKSTTKIASPVQHWRIIPRECLVQGHGRPIIGQAVCRTRSIHIAHERDLHPRPRRVASVMGIPRGQ